MRADNVLRAHRPTVIALAVVVPLLVCLILAQFRASVANTNAALVLVLVVVAAASTGMRPVGWAAAFASAVGFDLLLTEPYGRLTITDRADIETTVLLLAVGAAVTEIALWGRRLQAASSREQGYLDGLLSTDHAVATSQAPAADVVDQVCRTIVEVLGIDDCRYEDGSAPTSSVLAEDGSMMRAGRRIDVARRGLPTDTRIALPATSGGVAHGYFALTAATRVVRPTPGQLRIAVALAHQAGAALAAAQSRAPLSVDRQDGRTSARR